MSTNALVPPQSLPHISIPHRSRNLGCSSPPPGTKLLSGLALPAAVPFLGHQDTSLSPPAVSAHMCGVFGCCAASPAPLLQLGPALTQAGGGQSMLFSSGLFCSGVLGFSVCFLRARFSSVYATVVRYHVRRELLHARASVLPQGHRFGPREVAGICRITSVGPVLGAFLHISAGFWEMAPKTLWISKKTVPPSFTQTVAISLHWGALAGPVWGTMSWAHCPATLRWPRCPLQPQRDIPRGQAGCWAGRGGKPSPSTQPRAEGPGQLMPQNRQGYFYPP